MPRIDARVKASGALKYTADLELPGLAHAVCVRSSMPHARIVNIETAKAVAYPGVIVVLTAADLSTKLLGSGVKDIPILAREKVRYVGERVAVVVAESVRAARIGADSVEVDYDELPAVTSLDEALAPGSPLVHEAPWDYPRAAVKEEQGRNLQSIMSVGDEAAAAAALAGAAFVVDQTYRTQGVHQGYLETQSYLASYEPSGTFRAWSTHKALYRLREELVDYFEMEPSDFDLQPMFIGGDFGGKGTIGDGALCFELTRKIGRPVKMVMRYHEDLIATNPRHPSRTRVLIGCDASGSISGISVESVFDGGAYAGTKRDRDATLRGMLEPPNYRTGAFFVREQMTYTNTVPRGSMRAPGGPQVNFAIESALDELAAVAGIEPAELRRRNLLRTGDQPVIGHPWIEYRGHETLDAALGAFRPIAAPPGWHHGCGLAVYGRTTRTAATTSLRIIPLAGGRLRVEVPQSETGTGSHTVVRELVARRLGYPPDELEIEQVTTNELPKDHGASGSRVTSAIVVVTDVAAKAWANRVRDEAIEVEVESGSGPIEYGSMIVQVAQVAVDPDTGQIRVLELLSAIDVAEVINPMAHQMQIDGGMAMGFGFACLEDLDESDGQIWAANLGEFKLPSHRDVPGVRTVLVRGGQGIGEANVKNIGELSTPLTAAAVANAIFAATGCRIRELPLTAERLHDALFVGRLASDAT